MAGLGTFILENINSPGTSLTVNLGGAPTDRLTFASAFTTGASVFYFIDDGTQAEWGLGTFTTGSPNTLARTTVLGNTAGTVARLNFTSAALIYNEVPATYAVFLDPGGAAVILPGTTPRMSNLGPGVVGTDAANLNQTDWVVIGATTVSSSSADVRFSLSASWRSFMVDFVDIKGVTPGTSCQPYLQLSSDGGSTWGGGTAYIYADSAGNTGSTAQAALALGTANGSFSGRALISSTANPLIKIESATAISTTGAAQYSNGVLFNSAGPMNYVRLALFSQNIASGRVRLLGAL